MLQIATGRLFAHGVGRTNHLRGTIYTNAAFPYGNAAVPILDGQLLPPSMMSAGVKALAYEFFERMELNPNGTAGVIVSSTEAPYTLEFATVCSFALNCICSPDYVLVQRLIGNQRSVSTGEVPRTFIKRTFDADLILKDSEVEFLQAFVQHLIALPRVKFLGAMRAIRTYVTAMHRVADDLELAYTLLVASVESLAQTFDGHQGDWPSLEDRKRNAMDAALDGAPAEVAERVRAAMLSIEHVALARRFREFTLAHTTPAFFRSQAADVVHPTARSDLDECLRQAYTLRSKYVHELRTLPHLLTTSHFQREVLVDGQTQYFTLAGLTRLMRHVIVNFVMTQETVANEVYNYHSERYGVGLYPLAPEAWVGVAQGDITGAGKAKLTGFLEQLSSALLRTPGATVTDLSQVLTQANQFIPGITQELRRPYLALMALFNWFAPEHAHVPPTQAVQELIQNELGEPSSESLLAHCLTDQVPEWPLATHREALDSYFRRRTRKGLRVPRLFEAAMTLELAERFRAGDDEAEFRRLITVAVETDPGNKRLLELEANLVVGQAVHWRAVLLPPAAQPEQGAGAAEGAAPA